MSYNIGAICGYIGLGFLADRFGRKPIVMIFFAASLVLTFALYKWTTDLHLLLLVAAVNGFFTLGQYSWMSVWLPELYPTRMRATGMAFTFNSPRFIAFLGPLFAGMLIAQLRRLQRHGGDVLVHLHPGLRAGAVPAGDQGQAAAGVSRPQAIAEISGAAEIRRTASCSI